jgi:S-adenosylmethionine:tRNA ribosyltransferase-isomerase
MTLATDLFDYHLPPAAIAQTPADRRDESRLLVVHRQGRRLEHLRFRDIIRLLPPRTVLFRNNAKVIKARLYLQRSSGGVIELLLLSPGTTANSWWCLARPLKKLQVGHTLHAGDGQAVATLRQKSEDGPALFDFVAPPLDIAERYGKVPLPPYIQRERQDPRDATDNERYQTVYAQSPVAAAAPTAGLHFTHELIGQLEAQGHTFADVTLHVGLDTFRPIATEDVTQHKIHSEYYTLSPQAQALLATRDRPRLAVGTTSMRTIEDYTRRGQTTPAAAAELFIYPPSRILSADMLITNFHLPKSTLMCLVSSFLTPDSLDGISWLKEIYTHALDSGYRFYSYGDAMLIL